MRLSKIVIRIAVTLVISLLIILLSFYLFFAIKVRPFNVAEVRKTFSETALANSEFYHIIEDESRAKSNAIYLKIAEIPNITLEYSCNASVYDRWCKFTGYGDFAWYIWSSHDNEVDTLLEKYPSLHRTTSGRTIESNGNQQELLDFAKDLLLISDFDRLFQAYKAESMRTGSKDNDFDGKQIYFTDRDYHAFQNLFMWMDEQGL